MPLYDVRCEKCKKEVEVLQSFSAEAPLCCDEPMRILPTYFPAKIDIKGAHSQGYKEGYAKDYRRRLQESKT